MIFKKTHTQTYISATQMYSVFSFGCVPISAHDCYITTHSNTLWLKITATYSVHECVSCWFRLGSVGFFCFSTGLSHASVYSYRYFCFWAGWPTSRVPQAPHTWSLLLQWVVLGLLTCQWFGSKREDESMQWPLRSRPMTGILAHSKLDD